MRRLPMRPQSRSLRRLSTRPLWALQDARRKPTTATGVRRLLAPPSEGLPALSGVVRPTERSVWEFCLPVLEGEGLRFVESAEQH